MNVETPLSNVKAFLFYPKSLQAKVFLFQSSISKCEFWELKRQHSIKLNRFSAKQILQTPSLHLFVTICEMS